jgi:hypothetical protein
MDCGVLSISDSAKRLQDENSQYELKKIMKYICLGSFDEKMWETIPDSEQNDFGDECFTSSDVLRRNGHSAGAGALQTARIPTILRSKNGLAEQKLRAALHAAELAVWQASGGDFLRSGPAKSN